MARVPPVTRMTLPAKLGIFLAGWKLPAEPIFRVSLIEICFIQPLQMREVRPSEYESCGAAC